MKRPFEVGWEAGIRGEDPRCNPFDRLTSEWREWNLWHGWAVHLFWDTESPTNG